MRNVGGAVDNYPIESLAQAAVDSDENERKSWSTQDTYDGCLTKWILPRWRSYRLSKVKAVAVELWLKILNFSDGVSLARGSKAKIKITLSGR